MNKRRILFLDDDVEKRHSRFLRDTIGLKIHIDMVETAEEAKKALKENDRYDVVFLDHDLGGRVYVDSSDPNTGYQVAKFIAYELEAEKYPEYIFLHTLNGVGATNMKAVLNNLNIVCHRTPWLGIDFNHVVKQL